MAELKRPTLLGRAVDCIPAEYLHAIADCLPHLVWITSADGRLQFLNRWFLEYVGQPMNRLLGWDWGQAFHPDDLARTVDQWTHALQTGRGFSIQYRLRRHDGVFRWHIGRALPYRDADGVVRRWFGTCTDIDDQKRAEESLSALNVALANAVEGIARVDTAGRYVTVNPAFCQIAGYAPGEICGLHWEQTIHPADLEIWAAAYRRMRQSGRGEAELRGVRKDGSEFYQQMVIVRAEDQHEGFAGHYCFMRDVTEKRLAEEALRASETRFRALIENSYDAVELLALDGTILYASPAIVHTGGRTPEEVVGHKAFEWSHPDDLANLNEAFGTYLAEPGTSQRVESRYRHKDGSWRWAEATCTNLIHDPAVGAVVVNVHDVTDRKQAEDAVRASNDLLHAITAGTTDAVFVKDRDGRCLMLNAACAELLGRPIEEVVGKDDTQLFPPDLAAQIQADDLDVMQTEIARTYEETVPSPRGPRVLQTSKSPYRNAAGAVAGVVAISRDITDRKRLEEQLRQSQKMEAVGRLAGGVAHDFNNLLTVINGYSEIILASSDDHGATRSMLEEVHKAGKRAADLTRQLLAFSRQQILQPKVIDLNDVVAELAKMLRRMIGEDVELVIVPGPRLARVKADPGQIEQVIMNLAINARDAMPTGGRLTIETCNQTFSRGIARDGAKIRPGQYVVLSVSDTGCGMSPDVSAHVFEPFFTTKEHGTGLGLPTVYGIVEQSGGHIELETTAGRGTTFRAYLPAVDPGTLGNKKGSSAENMPRGTETVLVVEDEEGVRLLTQLMLQQLGYKVLTANCAQQAITVCQQAGPAISLVLADVVMPGQSGRSLIEQLQQQNPNLKAIYMSGYTDDSVVRHGVMQDRVNFIQKPFSAAALAAKVREVLDARGSIGV